METAVHLLDRGRIDADLNFVLDGHVVATDSEPNPDLEYGEFAVWNLLVDHPEATVLWDTGPHPDAGDGYWPTPLYEAFAHRDDPGLEASLAKAGFELADVDCVVASHLHLDHAGGLHHFDGTEIPVYVHADELGYAYLSAVTDRGSVAYWRPDFDHDLNWRVVDGDRQLFEGFELLHLPGHTPGLLGAEIVAGDERVLVTSDQAYLEPNYEAGHSMAASLLHDTRAWRDSLERLRDRERRTGADVLLGHDPDRLERFTPGWNLG
jgi:glyoxylase-like metal-dependent hydrolase (beta-lactamase superfamily II)